MSLLALWWLIFCSQNNETRSPAKTDHLHCWKEKKSSVLAGSPRKLWTCTESHVIVRLWILHWKPCDSEAVNFALKAMWWSGCSPSWHLLYSFLQVLSPTPVGQWIHLATPRLWPTCWEALASRTWSSSVSTMRSRDTWPKGSSWSLTGGKAGVRLWQLISIKKHLLVNYMSTLFNRQREFFWCIKGITQTWQERPELFTVITWCASHKHNDWIGYSNSYLVCK